MDVSFADPPEITLKVSSDKIMENDNVKFTCEAVANPADVNIKWQRNDEVIPGDHSTTYTIPRVTHGPVFRSTIENVAADIGSEVTLNCDVDGNPKPDTVWTFEGSDAVLSTQSKLVIPQLTLDRAGRYTCRATVVGFAEISTDVLVFIKGKFDVQVTLKTRSRIFNEFSLRHQLYNWVKLNSPALVSAFKWKGLNY
ncbi:UNVERIFIED_CONTAM: rst [Trichonephila clavipes]